jgi:hypothetical protein
MTNEEFDALKVGDYIRTNSRQYRHYGKTAQIVRRVVDGYEIRWPDGSTEICSIVSNWTRVDAPEARDARRAPDRPMTDEEFNDLQVGDVIKQLSPTGGWDVECEVFDVVPHAGHDMSTSEYRIRKLSDPRQTAGAWVSRNWCLRYRPFGAVSARRTS